MKETVDYRWSTVVRIIRGVIGLPSDYCSFTYADASRKQWIVVGPQLSGLSEVDPDCRVTTAVSYTPTHEGNSEL
jgi:hypothetical protein